MNREKQKNLMFKKFCEQKMEEGKSISWISKHCNYSYIHTKQICTQIKLVRYSNE